MKTHSFFILFFLVAINSTAQTVQGVDEAFSLACEKKVPVLIVFSGSDWCTPCMRAEKEIFSKKEFTEFITDHLIVYKADFPQRKKLSVKLQQENGALADQYNPQGIFPYFVLLRPDRTVIISFPYDNEFLPDFKKKLSTHLSNEQSANIQTSK